MMKGQTHVCRTVSVRRRGRQGFADAVVGEEPDDRVGDAEDGLRRVCGERNEIGLQGAEISWLRCPAAFPMGVGIDEVQQHVPSTESC